MNLQVSQPLPIVSARQKTQSLSGYGDFVGVKKRCDMINVRQQTLSAKPTLLNQSGKIFRTKFLFGQTKTSFGKQNGNRIFSRQTQDLKDLLYTYCIQENRTLKGGWFIT